MSTRPYPVTDLDSSPWWEALQRREFVLQSCAPCRRLRWPARAMCNDCGSDEWTWVSASGVGAVASWTVTHRPGPAGGETFVVVLVRLDDQDDILVPGYFDGPPDGAGLTIGLPVEVGFDEVEAGDDGRRLTVLRWRRAALRGGGPGSVRE
ncbi:hypothetical protein SAMN05421505_11132 [Sinosporangium album]|uniref:DUF35 domain-containing protein n=1 Tax=Sinosporangium album TaxID=504805 RepID=A0A1G7ZFP7_9ACTN|nr:OB-fold domain-containing protein [Sinosporangium album]SDH07397.1 hypothetical protein SAMN05421505_11132 [Sinosporangium album]